MRHDIARTLSVVKELADGKRLTLNDGLILAMGEDMSIGYVAKIDGEEFISGLAVLDLANLNKVLTKFKIGPVIPTE